jgi:gluconokinase
MANLGSGADGPAKLAVTIATSAAVRLTLDAPRLDPAGRTFCYRLDDRRFLAGGASNNGGNVIDWLRREIFRGRRSPDWLLSEAARVGPGSDGVLFTPYLHGERAPVWDPGASGAFFGLTRGVGRAHLVRAAVEGVALNLRLIAEALPPWKACRSIAMSGGAAQDPLWQRVVADSFDRPVEVAAPEAADASVLGAVMLAREALGLEPMPLPVPEKILQPEAAGVKIYRAAFMRFRELASAAGGSL